MSAARPANAQRGEAQLGDLIVRPSFAALVAAEAELGPLFALIERAAAGQVRLDEMASLFWHCRTRDDLDRAAFGDAIMAQGLTAALPVLRQIIRQILEGR